jgi:hypothetical protein
MLLHNKSKKLKNASTRGISGKKTQNKKKSLIPSEEFVPDFYFILQFSI